ncbi:MAG: ShlB/FhaC/HecB family hemolysin secretion/activation protein [Ideonella sp. MAG2]|nr:MAG: ShlB/FhaC/HecB family hemolysin secretion/activation protein [Ideonella sp. MAG2]
MRPPQADLPLRLPPPVRASAYPHPPRGPLWCHALLLALPVAAGAQGINPMAAPTLPDAGSVTRQLDSSRPVEAARQPLPAEVDGPPPPRPGAASVEIRTFVLRGNTALSDETLQAALRPWLNTPLDLAGLQSAAERVAATYQRHGRMATTRLGRQDVTDGVLTIDILEARFAATRLGGTAPQRVRPQQLLEFAAAQMKPGELLDTDAMNRALLLMDDLPGVAVTGSLGPGQRPGDTELVLEVADDALLAGRAQLDNAGSRSVGAERLTLQLSLNSPLGFGDQAQANALVSEGSRYLRLAYGMPLGPGGQRLQAWASHVDYRVISADFAALQASGRSSTLGGSATWPVLRSRMANLTLNLSAESKRYHNSASGSVSSHYGARSLQAEVSGNLFDDWGGGGANSAALSATAGQVNLAGSPNAAADAMSAQTAGRYQRWNLQLSRQQNLPDDASLFISGSAQYSGRNLDSAERMSLGGLAGVRAYPANEASGSSGHVLSVEFRRRMTDQWVLAGFYDTGRIRVYAQPLSPSGQSLLDKTAPNNYGLSGAGAYAIWTPLPSVQLQATVARRIGQHPSPSASGAYQDGSRRAIQAWFSASLSF